MREQPVGKHEASREHRISADTSHAGASFKVAVAATAADHRDVTWIESHGQTVAAIIPAQDYHPPDRCCCQNCPWDNDHREKT